MYIIINIAHMVAIMYSIKVFFLLFVCSFNVLIYKSFGGI